MKYQVIYVKIKEINYIYFSKNLIEESRVALLSTYQMEVCFIELIMDQYWRYKSTIHMLVFINRSTKQNPQNKGNICDPSPVDLCCTQTCHYMRT